MTDKPLVDVAITTYNHEKFIAQAIESVLAQETDFEYRLIIGDDCSSDNTQAVVKIYAERYPDQITTLLYAEHLGIEHKERVGVKLLERCTAKYIALLDGDDYWTDVHKLQKQVDFLESHPDFAICGHNATMLYEDGSKEPTNLLPPDHKESFSLEDLLVCNLIPTCSTVFRRGLFGELPDWYHTLTIGDWPLHIMNAQHGKIRYINEVMAFYRVHEGGLWSTRSSVSQWLEFIKMLDHLDPYLGFKYKKQIRAARASWCWEIAQDFYKQDDRIQGLSYAKKYFWLGGYRARRNLLGFFLKLRTPALYHSLRSVKEFFSSGKSNSAGVMGS